MSGSFGTNTASGGTGNAIIGLGDPNAGSQLLSLLTAEDLVPGSPVSYQTAKTIYLYHPLGAKMAETPIRLAQSQERDLSIGEPEDRLLRRFREVWLSLGGVDALGMPISADTIIANVKTLSRVYGIASLFVGERGRDLNTPLDLTKIADAEIYVNVLDPLNTAGSLVLDQDPSSPDFQRPVKLSVGGKPVHPSRCVVVMNEQPVYLEFSTTAFGFVGRSVYQRAFYPLKTFVQTMITDQYVTQKVGLLIAKLAAPGPITTNRIANFFGIKRGWLKAGITGNVLSINVEESVESLNFQNLEGPAKFCRENVLKNIAMACPMPSKLLEQEEMIGGMAEGTEDAKQIAHYINGVRTEMEGIYRFFDRLVMHRAWTEEFYETVKADMPEVYARVPYQTAFQTWKNSFSFKWPNLLEEPDSEKMQAEKIRFESAVALFEVMMPTLDPAGQAETVGWLVDEINKRRELFSSQLMIDPDTLLSYLKKQQKAKDQQAAQVGLQEPAEPKLFGANT